MSLNSTISLTPPTQDERTMATLAQALQLVGSWIAPLIILIIRRQSRFVSFHALQAMLLQIVYTVVIMFFVFGFLAMGMFGMFAQSAAGNDGPPVVFFLFPLLWLVIVGFGIFNLVVGIVYAIKAGRGEWAEYPVLGPLARRILSIPS